MSQTMPVDDSSLLSSMRKLLETNAEFDIIFVSNQKQEIKAHKIVLSLFSNFFKNLFNSNSQEGRTQIILLPNYSAEVVQSFIQFFYTGEVLIHEKLLPDFISLCREFNCNEIPALADILNPKVENTVEVPVIREPSVVSSTSVNNQMEIQRYLELSVDSNETEESENHVESIFFKVQSNEEIPTVSVVEEIQPSVKEEYLNEEYIEESPQYEFMEVLEKRISDDEQFTMEQSGQRGDDSWQTESDQQVIDQFRKPKERIKKTSTAIKKAKTTSISFPINHINIKQLREEQEKFKKRLQEAVNSVRDNVNSVKKAAKIFEVPTSAIERNLKNYKKAD